MTRPAEIDVHRHAVEREERTDAVGAWTESDHWHRVEQECACGAIRYRVKGGPWTPWEVEQPMKMGSLVRDKDGDLWRRGRTRWSCEAPVDGVRVTRVGRLPWSALHSMYGPLTVVRVGPAPREGVKA